MIGEKYAAADGTGADAEPAAPLAANDVAFVTCEEAVPDAIVEAVLNGPKIAPDDRRARRTRGLRVVAVAGRG
jgi:hypothetical protein